MSTSPCPSSANGQNPTPAGITFARSDEGLLVAKVGDNAFAMLPGSDGRFFLASAWHLRGPMDDCARGAVVRRGLRLGGRRTGAPRPFHGLRKTLRRQDYPRLVP